MIDPVITLESTLKKSRIGLMVEGQEDIQISFDSGNINLPEITENIVQSRADYKSANDAIQTFILLTNQLIPSAASSLTGSYTEFSLEVNVDSEGKAVAEFKESGEFVFEASWQISSDDVTTLPIEETNMTWRQFLLLNDATIQFKNVINGNSL